MAAHVIAAVQNVNDPAGFAEYQQLAEPTVHQYGGKFVAGGTKIEVADGNWSPIGLVVIEFESLDRGGILKKCVNSQAVYPLSEQHGLKAQERR